MIRKQLYTLIAILLLARLAMGIALAQTPDTSPLPTPAVDIEPMPEPAPEPDTGTLPRFLAALVSGVLTVPILRSLFLFAEERRGPIRTDAKRVYAVAGSFALGLLGFFGLVYLGYSGVPDNLEAWFDALWPVFTAAYTASQVVLSAARGLA